MKLKNERYEIDFEDSLTEHKGIAIDVVAIRDKKNLLTKGMKGLLFMSEDKGGEEGHEVWNFIEFKDEENLQLAQMGLELLQMALGKESEID